MQYIDGVENYHSTKSCAITFGKFDGFHRGHQALIGFVKALSHGEQMESVVCSIDKGANGVLTTKEEQIEKMKHEVDYLVNCPFSEEFRHIPAEDFIRDIIKGIFHAKYVVVGYNFRFGFRAEGDARFLESLAEKYDYKVVVIGKRHLYGRRISSTFIRDSLKRGEVDTANMLLGYNYGITGRICHGRKLGTSMGVPTINIEWPEKKLIPPRGVYLARVFVNGAWYNGVANIGRRPTVTDEPKVYFECFLLRFQGDIYGEEAKAEIIEFLRPEEKFGSIEELKARIKQDVIAAKNYFECSKNE